MSGSVPRGPGLQGERTELSWRRTLLALAVVALLTTRVLATTVGLRGLLAGAAALVVVVAVGVAARGPHRRLRTAPAGPARMSATGGLLLVLAVAASVLAAVDLLALLMS